VKEDKDTGEVSFQWYNKETKCHEKIDSIKGAKLGNCMSLEIYDMALDKSWVSNYVFDTQGANTMIFDPIKKGRAFDKSVSYEDAKNWLLTKVGGSLKAYYNIWVFDFKTQQIYAVKTNSTLAIYQNNKIEKKITDGYSIELTPSKYQDGFVDGNGVSDKFKNMAKKNPPKFASVELSDKMDASAPYMTALDAAFDDFLAFKLGSSSVVSPPTVEKEDTVYAPKEESHIDGLMKRTKVENTPDLEPSSVEDDDLPF
jgi:hypothetical protein